MWEPKELELYNRKLGSNVANVWETLGRRPVSEQRSQALEGESRRVITNMEKGFSLRRNREGCQFLAIR